MFPAHNSAQSVMHAHTCTHFLRQYAVPRIGKRQQRSGLLCACTGTIVMFRHGARTPVFRLPDSPANEVDWSSLVLKQAPTHAVPIDVQGGKSWNRAAAAEQAQGKEPMRVNVSSGGGLLTNLGWSQGEALGRRLRAIYGTPSLDSLEVISTDMLCPTSAADSSAARL